MVSTYFLNCIMGNVFKTKTSPALPSKVYLGLSKTTPTMSGTGITEPAAAAGYARVELKNLSVPNNGIITNNIEVSFPKSTAEWGTVTHFVLYDAATGGNFLLSEKLAKSRTVEEDVIVILETGKLKFTLKNVS